MIQPAGADIEAVGSSTGAAFPLPLLLAPALLLALPQPGVGLHAVRGILARNPGVRAYQRQRQRLQRHRLP